MGISGERLGESTALYRKLDSFGLRWPNDRVDAQNMRLFARFLLDRVQARILPYVSTVMVLMVRVRGDSYGIPSAEVVEIIRAVAVSPLPGSPTVISGIINLRGEMVVVIDPAVRFGMPDKPVTPDDNFVIVKTPKRVIAVRVDTAEDLLDIDDEVLTAATAASPTVGKLKGIASMPDGALVIYDAAAFLGAAEEEAIEEALLTVSQTA